MCFFPLFICLNCFQRGLGEGCLDCFRRCGGNWSPRFSRPFNDWEMDDVERFLLCLCGKRVNLDEEDRVWWMESKNGKFSFKSIYKSLELGSFFFSPNEDHLELLCATKSKLLCLGGNVG